MLYLRLSGVALLISAFMVGLASVMAFLIAKFWRGDIMEQAEKMRWIMTREFMRSTVFQSCITVGQNCDDLKILEWLKSDDVTSCNYKALKGNKMEKELLEKIKYLREKTNCPYWAIKCCLILNDYDVDKAYKDIADIYYIIGDHPNVVVKRNEEKLKERMKKYE